ncbi:uncharacterized protein BDV14DRAFT_183926 [Aspergillus stella-maris]|uniref:uncharacterized protein n=1 Tax=Aspergillus stella-maris TaxID=1810926 RepID=UPI003CCE019A
MLIDISSRIIYCTSLRLIGQIRRSSRSYNLSPRSWGGLMNNESRPGWLVRERQAGLLLSSGCRDHLCIAHPAPRH